MFVLLYNNRVLLYLPMANLSNMNNFNEESQFSQANTLCVPIQSLEYSVPNKNVVKENETIVSPNNRFSPYTSPSSSRSSSIRSTQSHVKFGTYNPTDWTSQTIMDLLQITNDGRFILADAKLNNGSLSDEGQNTLTKLLINCMFQDKSKGTDLFFRKISSLITEIFPNEEQFSCAEWSDHKTANVLTLLLIPYLIPTKTIIRKCDASGVKKNWKPSWEESAKSFVTFVLNISQISSEIIQRQKQYSQYGCTIQPFVYLVGEDLSSVSQSYVRVDQWWANFFNGEPHCAQPW
ncbi:hypothetical protein AGLY_007401 [Aphis glycines]|uniref:Uncharacterized protein n=1 Tax=Aphis glycines TaxID=307491 RepID=A0A6G0TQT8_APHGL|nr:hypothetical protein AGLY_007401 [Aphis glycines]